MTARLTPAQRRLLAVLRERPRHGFDRDDLAKRMETSPEGAAQTAASLVRRGLVIRFVGGVGRQRVRWQAKP